MAYDPKFGERLRNFRKSRSETQTEFGKHLNLTQQAVAKYETLGSIPESDVLIKIGRLDGASLDWLLFGSRGKIDQPLLLTAIEVAERAVPDLDARSKAEVIGELYAGPFLTLGAKPTRHAILSIVKRIEERRAGFSHDQRR